MIRFLAFAFLSFSLFIYPIAAADIETSGTSDDKTLYENINAIPELSYTSSALNSSFLLDIAAAVADCANVVVSGENVKSYTIFVPTNDALKEALFYFRAHAGGSDYGPTEEQQRLLLSQVATTGKLDLDALRFTENQKAKMRAAFLYSIIPGECSDADLNHPVQFMPTLLQPKINIQVTQDPQQAASKRKSQGLSRSASGTRGVEDAPLSDRTKDILRSLPTDFSDEVKLGKDESQRLQIINLNAHGDLATIIGYESTGVAYKNSSIKIQFPAQATAQRLQPPTASRPPSNPQSTQQLPDQGLSTISHRGFAESSTQAKTLIGRLEKQEQRGLLQSNVIRANIKSSNGMLHIIDRILITPLNTTLHLKVAQLNHTIDAISQSATLKKQLNDRQQLTLFAPSEQAWKKFISRYQEIVIRQESRDDDDDDDAKQAVPGKRADTTKRSKKVKNPAPYQNLDSDENYSPLTNVLDVFTKEQLDAIINAHTAFDVVLYSSAIGRYNPESDNSALSTRSAIRSLAKTPTTDTIHLPVRTPRQIGGSIIRTNDGNEHSVRKAARGFAVDDAFILYPNIMTKNGVVQVINQFLLTPQQLIQMPIKRKEMMREVRPTPTVTTEQKKKTPTPTPAPQYIPGNRTVPAGQTCLNLTALSLIPTLKPQPPTPALDCPEGDQICYVLDITQACDADTAVQGDTKQISDPSGDIPQGEPRLSGKCPPLLIGSTEASRSYSRSRSAKSFRLFAASQSVAMASNFTDQTQLNYVARCYSPKTHVCVNNHFLCPVHAASLCGNQCYDSAKFRCYSTFSLCPASAPSLCFGACYHKNEYTCTVNGLQSKQKDTTPGKRQP